MTQHCHVCDFTSTVQYLSFLAQAKHFIPIMLPYGLHVNIFLIARTGICTIMLMNLNQHISSGHLFAAQ